MTKDALKDIKALKKSGNKVAFEKLQILIKELKEHPTTGTGKPKQLTGNRMGQWSRRITQHHRLVYIISNDIIEVLILSVINHYDK